MVGFYLVCPCHLERYIIVRTNLPSMKEVMKKSDYQVIVSIDENEIEDIVKRLGVKKEG